VAPDLVEKEAKQIWQRRRMVLGEERWWRRMVLGGGTANVVSIGSCMSSHIGSLS
jgi:hypothetical protein